jgi:hypothetical protein
MADQNTQNTKEEYGQNNEGPRRGVHPISGEPENRRNPGHETNQAGSDPVNLREDGSRNDRPATAVTPEGEVEEHGPENREMFENEPGRIPNNRTQAEQRKDAQG